MSGKVCSFFGHRIVEKNFNKDKLYNIIENLILQKGYDTFLFGGFGEFDELCHQIVTQLKNIHPFIKRVYCLTDEKFLRKNKRPKYLKDQDYEEFIYLSLDFDFWYTRIYYRNCEMIKRSNLVVFYVQERENSGAFKALKFAIKNKSEYINLK